MSIWIRSVSVWTVAAGLISGCGGDRVTSSIAPEADTSVESVRPATRQASAARALGKLAPGGNAAQAVVVATVLRDGTPVSGVALEIARSVSGRTANYVAAGSTDANGKARLAIGGVNVGGYYRVRATQADGLLDAWSSIPLNAGYEVTVELPVGGKARVTGSSSLSTPDIVGSWEFVGTNMIETISGNLIAAILAQGDVDSATAVSIVQQFTGELETSMRNAAWSVRRFHADGTFADQDSTGAWSDAGTWSVSGNTLSMAHGDGLTIEASYAVDGDDLTLTFTGEAYMGIVLQAAGELNEEDREFFDAMVKDDDVIRFFYQAL